MMKIEKRKEIAIRNFLIQKMNRGILLYTFEKNYKDYISEDRLIFQIKSIVKEIDLIDFLIITKKKGGKVIRIFIGVRKLLGGLDDLILLGIRNKCLEIGSEEITQIKFSKEIKISSLDFKKLFHYYYYSYFNIKDSLYFLDLVIPSGNTSRFKEGFISVKNNDIWSAINNDNYYSIFNLIKLIKVYKKLYKEKPQAVDTIADIIQIVRLLQGEFNLQLGFIDVDLYEVLLYLNKPYINIIKEVYLNYDI